MAVTLIDTNNNFRANCKYDAAFNNEVVLSTTGQRELTFQGRNKGVFYSVIDFTLSDDCQLDTSTSDVHIYIDQDVIMALLMVIMVCVIELSIPM